MSDSNEYADIIRALRVMHGTILAETGEQFRDSVKETMPSKAADAIETLLAKLNNKPMDDEALVEIVAREIAFAQGDVESPNSEFMDENWHCWEPEARAAISAIRPHIEAAERERCAKIAETPELWVTDKPTRGCDDIAAAIRSGK